MSLLAASFAPQVFAAPYPGSGAPVACNRAVSADGDPSNPFSYPFIADIAKSLAKSGFPASFFLSGDTAKGPGIDLRTILLYETGILKTPVRFFVPSKSKDAFPSLSIGAIPDSPGTMPDEPPQLKAKGSLEDEQGKGPVRNEQAAEGKGSALNLDMTRFSIDLSDASHKNEVTTKLSETVGTLAMAPQIGLELQPAGHDTESRFHFWTVPQAVSSAIDGPIAENFRESSFVMMSPTGLKSIDGRSFSLTKGHILAYSLGKPISVATPAGRVTVEPGASAFVEVLAPGCTRVRVLESSKSEHGVSVRYTAAGKAEEMRLAAGEDLLVADHKLTDSEKAAQAKSGTAGDSWSKATFSCKSLLDTEAFFRTDLSNQNREQRQAVLWLKKRVK